MAPAAAWAQHAHPVDAHRLHQSMWWSALLMGLMPYAIGLVVLGAILYHRRKRARRGPDDRAG